MPRKVLNRRSSNEYKILPYSFKRELEQFVVTLKTSIECTLYGGAGRFDGCPYGPRINEMLEQYETLTPREQVEAARNIVFLRQILEQFPYSPSEPHS